jgi:hypothetical protein
MGKVVGLGLNRNIEVGITAKWDFKPDLDKS